MIVAALKITNDLERIGDLAVNLAQRVITLREMPGAQLPDELAPMAAAVRAMVSKSLGALIFRNADMAALVLESDDVVDKYRDTIFEKLMENMTQQASLVSSGMQFVLATRHLERIADHATIEGRHGGLFQEAGLSMLAFIFDPHVLRRAHRVEFQPGLGAVPTRRAAAGNWNQPIT